MVFSARVAGREEAWSTNFDLYEAPADGSSAPRNLTSNNPAWDTQPVYLRNGDLAWLAMSRPGFEADRFRIKLMHDGAVRDVAPNWDRSVLHLDVANDGRTLLATANDLGQTPLFRVDVDSGRATPISGKGYVGDFATTRRATVVLWHDLGSPPDLYLLPNSGERRRLTHVNEGILAGRTLGTFEQFSFPGWNDETVYGYIVNPPGFAKDGKYPVAFIVHGGPQVSFQNHWNWRWNAQTFAARGYAVGLHRFSRVAGLRPGIHGFDQPALGRSAIRGSAERIRGGAAEIPWLDGQRACSLGASYGGYMQNWIAGNWPDGFRCIVNHDGIFDTRSMYYTTEELWFTEWENGGPYYQAPEIHERFNPAHHVKNGARRCW